MTSWIQRFWRPCRERLAAIGKRGATAAHPAAGGAERALATGPGPGAENADRADRADRPDRTDSAGRTARADTTIGAAVAARLSPAMARSLLQHELPRRRTAEQWLTLAAAIGLAALVCWLMAAAWYLTGAARDAAAVRLKPPVLAAYGPLERLSLLPSGRLSPELMRPQAPGEDRLLRAWQNIAALENARAEPVLRAARSLLQGVVPGSAAERAGLQAGDLVARVNAKEAGYVWDVYKALTDGLADTAQLAVQRGDGMLQLVLRAGPGEALDMTNHGLLFAVPEHVRYIGRSDTERLRQQSRAGFVESLPPEWRSRYVEGLLALSGELVGNLSRIAAVAPGQPGYLRTEDLVLWYHRAFNEALSFYRVEQERSRDRQTTALAQLGWGLLAGGLVALAVLAQWARRSWRL